MLISVVVPCRNEVKYISRSIETICDQKVFENDFEVIVVDGMSEDGTREVLIEKTKKYPNLTIKDNHRRITPVARNIGIHSSKGEYICIMDAHTEYDSNYLQNCFKLLQKHEDVSCVGGPITSVGESDFGKATAYAMSCRIGVGNAKHRFPNYEGYAEMACFPMFRREVFETVGHFDETLIRNQDDEFSLRYRLAGGKVFISPRVKSVYYVRNSPPKLFKQYFQYGYWRWVVVKKHKIQISYRQMIPSFFILLLTSSVLFGLIIRSYTCIFLIPLIYFVTISAFSLKIVTKESWKIGLFFIEAVIILHFSYGLGVIYSFLKDKLNK